MYMEDCVYWGMKEVFGVFMVLIVIIVVIFIFVMFLEDVEG